MTVDGWAATGAAPSDIKMANTRAVKSTGECLELQVFAVPVIVEATHMEGIYWIRRSA
jgi:hypothetical protein